MLRKSLALFLTIILILPMAQPLLAGESAPGQEQSSASSLPHQPMVGKKGENPNLCPICGKSWDTGSHAECLQKILPKETEVVCPSCLLEFYVEEPKALGDTDRDLCPHTTGTAGASGEIYICPRCGFAYLSQFFLTSGSEQKLILPTEQRKWIRENLTPRIYQAIRSALGNIKKEYQPKDEELYTLFNDTTYIPQGLKNQHFANEHIVERQVPDSLRCENALLYAKQFYRDEPMLCARMAQLAAWSYRRMVSDPPVKVRLMKSLQHIEKSLAKELPENATQKQNVDQMWAMFENQDEFNIIDREFLLIMIAGKYLRLGTRAWAKECITRCLKDVDDDQLWSPVAIIAAVKPGTATPPTPQEIQLARVEILQLASPLPEAIEKEAVYLQEAAGFLRAALARDKIPVQILPAHIYLVGEFERRSSNFARAHAWLELAAKMDTGKLTPGAEIWAAEQLELVNDSLAHLGHAEIPANPMAAEDTPLLQSLAEKYQVYLQALEASE
ncbi:MAG: hypothetical protein JXA52_08220 [Planctomycetes bacterium]|nr:hypothetical protein [Planctomycetota bacterium]